MMKRYITAVALCLLSAAAFAQVPGTMNYQGRVVVDGTNYDGAADFKFALVDGGSNGSATATGTGNVIAGFLVEIPVADGGLGYVTPPTVTIDDTTGSGASATAFINGGVVTGVTVDVPGGSYSPAPTITFSAPPPVITYTTYWSNDGTPAGEPSAAVGLNVTKGLFSVALGDTNLANMTAIPSSVFMNPNVNLRVWFDDSGGSQVLEPNQRISSVGYAMVAGEVPPITITSNMVDWSTMPAGLVDGDDDSVPAETDPLFGAASNNIVVDGDMAGGDLAGTYPNPTIDTGSVSSQKIDWATMPAGLMDGDDEGVTVEADPIFVSVSNSVVYDGDAAGGDLIGTYPDPSIANTAVSSQKIDWVTMPGGLVDGDDNTTYTAGEGLDLSGTEFSLTNGAVSAAKLADGAVSLSKLEGIADTRSSLQIPDPTPVANEGFGMSVAALGGDRVLIGVNGDRPVASRYGGAYVYDLQGSQLVAITNPTPVADEQFGYSVAVAGGDTLAIGDIDDSKLAASEGGVYLYDTNGVLTTVISNPVPEINDWFGFSLAAVGTDRLLIGAQDDHVAGATYGSAYLYDLSGNLLVTMTNPTPANWDGFGGSVGIVGDEILVIGDRYDDSGRGAEAGAVYLYDTNGTLLVTITNPATVAADSFGRSVGSEGDTVIIGATGAGGSGEVYLYDTNGTLLLTIPSPNPGTGDWFGFKVSGTGDGRVIIADHREDVQASEAGAVFIYDLAGNLLNTVTSPDASPDDDWFGFSIATTGSSLVVGAVEDDPSASGAGAVYVFDMTAKQVSGLVAQTVADGGITTAKIEDGAIMDVDISATASIDPTKVSGTAATLTGSQSFDGSTLRIDAGADQVGVGDSSPDAKLDVLNSGSGDSFRVDDQLDGDTTPFIITANGSVGIGDETPVGKLQVAGDEVRIGSGGTPGLSLSDGDLYVENDLEVDGILSVKDGLIHADAPSGTVGINDANPDAKLDVLNTGSGDSLRVDDDADGDATPFVIDADGNVGIGTNAPSEKLHIFDSSNRGDLMIEDTYPFVILNATLPSGNAGIKFQRQDTTSGYITLQATSSNMTLRASSSGAELRITPAGELGFDTQPTETLDMNGGRIGNVGDPDSDDDAVNRGYMENALYATNVYVVSACGMGTYNSGLTEIFALPAARYRPTSTGSAFAILPLQIPSMLNGVTQHVRKVEVAFETGDAQNYVSEFHVNAQIDDGVTTIGHLSTFTDWDNTTMQTYTFDPGGPSPIIGSLYLRFVFWSGSTSFDYEFGMIRVTISP